MTENDIQNALKTVKYPGFSRDIVSFGLVKEIAVKDGAVSVTMQLTSGKPELAQQIKAETEAALKSVPGMKAVHVEVKLQAASQAASPQSPWNQSNKVPGIQRVVAVASGKGGVGKSTLSVNLACRLAAAWPKSRVLDCDIYGPSIPLIDGNQSEAHHQRRRKMVPPSNHGVKLMAWVPARGRISR